MLESLLRRWFIFCDKKRTRVTHPRFCFFYKCSQILLCTLILNSIQTQSVTQVYCSSCEHDWIMIILTGRGILDEPFLQITLKNLGCFCNFWNILHLFHQGRDNTRQSREFIAAQKLCKFCKWIE